MPSPLKWLTAMLFLFALGALFLVALLRNDPAAIDIINTVAAVISVPVGGLIAVALWTRPTPPRDPMRGLEPGRDRSRESQDEDAHQDEQPSQGLDAESERERSDLVEAEGGTGSPAPGEEAQAGDGSR